MIDGYPEEEVLEQIKSLDASAELDAILNLLKENWWGADDGFILKGNKLTLHTWGWSGNEDMINALIENQLFWGLYWESSTRGGHYIFKLRKIKKEN